MPANLPDTQTRHPIPQVTYNVKKAENNVDGSLGEGNNYTFFFFFNIMISFIKLLFVHDGARSPAGAHSTA